MTMCTSFLCHQTMSDYLLTVHDNRWQSILSGVYDTCSHKQVRVYQYSRKYGHLFPLILTVQTSGILCHQSFP